MNSSNKNYYLKVPKNIYGINDVISPQKDLNIVGLRVSDDAPSKTYSLSELIELYNSKNDWIAVKYNCEYRTEDEGVLKLTFKLCDNTPLCAAYIKCSSSSNEADITVISIGNDSYSPTVKYAVELFTNWLMSVLKGNNYMYRMEAVKRSDSNAFAIISKENLFDTSITEIDISDRAKHLIINYYFNTSDIIEYFKGCTTDDIDPHDIEIEADIPLKAEQLIS